MATIVYTKDAPEPIGPYSQAIRVGDTLYSSGQIAIGNLEDGIGVQTRTVCENIVSILAAADMTVEHVVKTTCYLVQMNDFDDFNEVYGEFFSHKPARSTVEVSALPKNALVEIDFVAVRD